LDKRKSSEQGQRAIGQLRRAYRKCTDLLEQFDSEFDDDEEYLNCYRRYISDKTLWQFEYFVYTTEYGNVETDLQDTYKCEAYSRKIDYEYLWGAFHVEDETENE